MRSEHDSRVANDSRFRSESTTCIAVWSSKQERLIPRLLSCVLKRITSVSSARNAGGGIGGAQVRLRRGVRPTSASVPHIALSGA